MLNTPPIAPGAEVSLAQARAFVLAKQGLSAPGPASVVAATWAAAGVYSTAPTCYLSYAGRLEGFRIAQLDQELFQHRSLVRLRCMRDSAYIVPVAALPVVVAATIGDGGKAAARLVRQSGLDDDAYALLADRIEGLLTGRPPATVPELRELLGAHAPPRREALQFAVGLLSRQGRLVRAEVRGGWRSDTYAYARWTDWLGAPDEAMEPAAARAELARMYLRAFGPATAADLKWWAGWTIRDTTAAIEALGDEISPLALTEPGQAATSALVLSEELSALRATEPESARGVRLLPVWDVYLMGYIERRRFVADTDYGRIYDRAGNGTSVALIDGVAAGVWEFEVAAKPTGDSLTVRVAPFGNTAIERWREVAAAAARIATTIGANDLRVERAPQPGPLANGARNAFLSPIKLGKAL